MKTNINTFTKKINIKVKNIKLLENALTHKSANKKLNNEKLEFLGDRVLGLAISTKLYDLYPNETEGVLDKRFAKLVNRNTCATIAWSTGIKDFIILGDRKKKITILDEKILSDACEALLGAIYIDRGFTYVNKLILKLWNNEIKKSIKTVLDSKTELQEYSLKKYKKLPEYKVISFEGPRHNPIFKISVSIKNSKSYFGTGNSKKQAQQNAAKNLLKIVYSGTP
jgi:ribonuclease III